MKRRTVEPPRSSSEAICQDMPTIVSPCAAL
jgi:hypothetical protein